MYPRRTLAHGPTFHLYRESFDDPNVYFALEGAQFTASSNHVTVSIPVHVWEFIRRHPGIEFDYADRTDEELFQYVEREVENRLKDYQAGRMKGHVKIFEECTGVRAFGSIKQPREMQIAKGVAHFTQIRSHQRQVLQAIAGLEQFDK